MNYREFGCADHETILLLHGGGLSWWNYRETAENLASDYHVILPLLDGHAGSDADFTSIEDNAARIISFIDECFGGSVLLIGGLSLGGQILLEILAQRKDICRYALIESALGIPSNLTHALIKPAFGSCHGLIRCRWFSALQFRSLKIKPELFEDYYRDTCAISKQNLIAFLQANALYAPKTSLVESLTKASIFAGQRENKAIIKSAALICQMLPKSGMTILPNMVHGEFSINHPADYANTIIGMIGK